MKDFCLISDYREVEKSKENDKSGKLWVGYQVNFMDHPGDDVYMFKFFTSRNFHEENGISDWLMTGRWQMSERYGCGIIEVVSFKNLVTIIIGRLDSTWGLPVCVNYGLAIHLVLRMGSNQLDAPRRSLCAL